MVMLCEIVTRNARIKAHGPCANFSHISEMVAAGPRLKILREAAVPRLSIRAMADRLEMPSSSYASYENPAKYKKPHLPIELTRRIAVILAQHGVSAADVMKLAGLVEDEADPEAAAIEAQRPTAQFAFMRVELPSEAALADMFRSLLAIVPEGTSRDETARILARRLPAGFAAIGPHAPDPSEARTIEDAAVPPSRATDHPERERASRS